MLVGTFVIAGWLKCQGAAHRNHLVLNTHHWHAAESYNLQRLSKRQLFEVILSIFFKQPTRRLNRMVQNTLVRVGGRQVGVQIRVGSTKFSDPARYDGSSAAITDCFVTQTRKLCGGNCTVFLTTDSEEAQDLFVAGMRSNNITVCSCARKHPTPGT